MTIPAANGSDMDFESYTVECDEDHENQRTDQPISDLLVEEIDVNDPEAMASAIIWSPSGVDEPQNDLNMADDPCTNRNVDGASADSDPDFAGRFSQLQYKDAPDERQTSLEFPRTHDNRIRRKRRRSTGESLPSGKLQRRESKSAIRKVAKRRKDESAASAMLEPPGDKIMSDELPVDCPA